MCCLESLEHETSFILLFIQQDQLFLSEGRSLDFIFDAPNLDHLGHCLNMTAKWLNNSRVRKLVVELRKRLRDRNKPSRQDQKAVCQIRISTVEKSLPHLLYFEARNVRNEKLLDNITTPIIKDFPIAFETNRTNEEESVGLLNSSSERVCRSSSSGVVAGSISRLLRFSD